MLMQDASDLKLPIGRNSNGDIVVLDVFQSQNIFISYSEAEQLDNVIKFFILNENQLKLYLAVNSRYTSYFKDRARFKEDHGFYFFDNPYRSSIKSKKSFINTIYQDYKKRTNTTSKIFPKMIVMVDNIWNLIQSISKSTGTKFLDLLFNAHQHGIHFVMASPTSYHNLFYQIVQPGPVHQKMMLNAGINIPYSGVSKVGAEIIYNTEDFVFLKPYNSMDMNRLYKL